MELRVTKQWNQAGKGSQESISQPFLKTTVFLFSAENLYWLVVWNIFYVSIQLGIIIPTDFHIFQRGRYTTNQSRLNSFGFVRDLYQISRSEVPDRELLACHVW